MAQNYIKFNGAIIRQPDTGLGWDVETTYTAGSGRSMTGEAQVSPLFTVEALSYTASCVSIEEASQIPKGSPFDLTYFSPYFGEWRTDKFYVGKGSLSISILREGEEFFDSLSFQMTGVNPI